MKETPKRKITHDGPDTDAFFSLAAVDEYMPGMADIPIEYVGADWDGEGMNPGDIAVDLDAGGKGIKGKRELNGTVHSAFRTIIEQNAPKEDQEGLKYLVEYIDILDQLGSPIHQLIRNTGHDNRRIMSKNSLLAVFHAIKNKHPDDTETVYSRIKEIFRGYILMGRDSSGKRRSNLGYYFTAWSFSKYVPKSMHDESIETCASRLISEYADKELYEYLKDLATFIDEYDTPGLDKPQNEILMNTSIASVLRALEYFHDDDEAIISKRMNEIFEGIIESGKAYARAEIEASKAERFANGLGAIVINRKEPGINQILKRDGVVAVIFQQDCERGTSLGISTKSDILRADHPEIIATIRRFGEDVLPPNVPKKNQDDWFVMPHVIAHGTIKAPPKSKSKVPLYALKSITTKLLNRKFRNGKRFSR